MSAARKGLSRLVLSGMLVLAAVDAAIAQIELQAGDWTTRCDSRPDRHADDCFATLSLRGSASTGIFAIVIMLQIGEIGIAGKPPPKQATIRVDTNPPFVCSGTPYCVFSREASHSLIKQLDNGHIALVDILTAGKTLHFSFGTSGFRAGTAKLRAWRYPLPFK
jgi:invasion protein IalB